MLQLPNKVSGRLEVDVLFIQPTYWCSNNCKNCYVKSHIRSKHTCSLKEISKAYLLFYEGEKAWANQISVSIDDTSGDINDPKAIKMANFYDDIIFSLYSCDPSTTHPEVHLTFRSVDTIIEYSNLLGYYSQDLTKGPKVISLSEITNPDKLKDIIHPDVHINYNHLCPESFNIDNQIKKLIEIGEVVDTIYLIVHKPVGKSTDYSRDKFRSDTLYINTLMKKLPSHIRSKINIDGCIKDIMKYHKTGYGCSSNISKFQIWPDGSVSGCPYIYKSCTPQGSTVEQILNNIRTANQYYNFDTCCLKRLVK